MGKKVYSRGVAARRVFTQQKRREREGEDSEVADGEEAEKKKKKGRAFTKGVRSQTIMVRMHQLRARPRSVTSLRQALRVVEARGRGVRGGQEKSQQHGFLLLRKRGAADLRLQRLSLACAAKGDDDGKSSGEGEEVTDLVYQAQTPAGEMLSYYLSEQPHLFQDAVDEQLKLLETEKEERNEKKTTEDKKKSSEELVLYQRMEEVRGLEMTRNLEDLMYFAVVERFTNLGVSMLSPLDDVVDI